MHYPAKAKLYCISSLFLNINNYITFCITTLHIIHISFTLTGSVLNILDIINR